MFHSARLPSHGPFDSELSEGVYPDAIRPLWLSANLVPTVAGESKVFQASGCYEEVVMIAILDCIYLIARMRGLRDGAIIVQLLN